MSQTVFMLLEILGGLAVFVLGISNFSEGLKKISSSKIKDFLSKVTSSPLSGTLLGLAVTALIQSSSATTVLTVGFVNAGLMDLAQAIGIVYGANIGTTITAQIMAFKIADYALLFVLIGTILYVFGMKSRVKYFGSFLIGFGFIFLGMHMMKEGIEPFKKSQVITNFFITFSHKPLLGVLVGMLMTFIVQSSSATVGIVLTLVSQGFLDLNGAIPIILGDNIGTCITAALAAIGGNISAKRVAVAHFGFNIIGTVIVLVMLPFYTKIILWTTSDPARQVANAHTLFNVMNAILFLPFTKYYTMFITKIIKGRLVIKHDRAIYLSKNLLDNSSIAIDAVRKEISRSLQFGEETMIVAKNYFEKGDVKNIKIMKENENIIDNIQFDVTNYLIQLSSRDMTNTDARYIPKLLHAINDAERIGDHGQNLFNIFNRMEESKIKFSDLRVKDISSMIMQIILYIQYIVKGIENCENLHIEDAYDYEKEINRLRDHYRQNYFDIIASENNDPVSASTYYDIILNLEKIGDHLTNIAEALVARRADNDDSEG